MATSRGAPLRAVPQRIDTPVSGITWIGRPSAEHAPLVVSDMPTSSASSAPETNAGTSPEMAALRREEVVRARHFARWIFLMCVFGLIVQQLNHAETAMRIPMRIAIFALGGSAAWLWHGASRTDDYAKIQVRIRDHVSARIRMDTLRKRAGQRRDVPRLRSRIPGGELRR